MAIRQSKKISELNALTSASLNTYVLGVDNGATYKITLDVLEDAVINMVSRSTDLRLDALESFTSSYNAIASPNGLISGSAQITALGFVSSSNADLTSLNSFTSSQSTLNTAFTNGINGRLQTSSFNTFSASVHSEIIAATNEQSLTHLVNTSSFNQYTASISTASLVDRLNQIENVSGSWIAESETGSFLTSLNGAISSSSQLTSSYDTRYTLSGSITQTTWDNIDGKPDGLVSQSVNLSSLNTFTASYFTDSASIDSRVLTEKGRIDAILSASNANTDTFAEIVTLINSVDTTNDNAFASYYTSSNARISSLENATSSYETKGSGIVSGSSQLTASFDTRYTLSGSSVSINTGSFATTGSNTFTDDQNFGEFNLNFDGGNIQTSFSGIQLKSTTFSRLNYDNISYVKVDVDGAHIDVDGIEWKFRNDSSILFPDSTIQTTAFTGIPNGTISGSSQLTASYDTRYTLSGSVSAVPAGTISGSSQLTASYDARYALSSSVSSISSSFNGRFNGLVTTGSNTFSGSQIFSGSMTVTSGQVIASTITNNSSSLYLTSGSNLYVQNNGIVEITGSIVLNGTTYTSLTGSGAIPAGTISGSSQLTASYDARYAPSASYLTSLNGALSSSTQVTNGSGIVSGSSQLTASFDVRYTLSGSGGTTTIPDGTVSGSSQLTSSYDARYLTIGGDGVISGSSQITGIVNLTNLSATSQVSASVFVGGFGVPEAKFTVIQSKAITFWPNTTLESVRFTTAGGVIIGKNGETNDFGNKLDVSGSVRFIGNTTITGSLIGTQGFTGSIAATNGIVSGSSQLTSSYDTRYTLSGSVGATPAGTISGSSQLTASFDTRYLTIDGDNVISSSTQLTSSFETIGRGIISSSAQLPSGLISGSSQLPNGIVSGSSQLTASYDIRYALSGSGGSATIPAGTVSGSSQLTSSYDGRYTLTSSFNSFTASAQAITTGSNSFNGTQTITGSLIITTGSFFASQLVANTASLYLTSGSNLYVQNNGLVEITGSLIATSITGSIAATNGVVSGSSQLTASYDTRYTLSGSVSSVPVGTVSGSSQLTSSYDLRYEGIGRGIVSGSTQLTASFETIGRGIISSSAQLPIGIISSSAQLPNALVSGSSQLTASYDLRYEGVGRGIVSGSSQLTSSFDGRYLQTGSFNSYTSSNDTTNTTQNNRLTTLENKTGSLATTGSNTFIGNETISGSLLVSGSTQLTGSLSIQSGSITMPNRPAIRITGAGGAKVATTPLTGSYLNVDYQQGNVWDSATGTFTAPIAGLYMVTLVVRTNSNSLGSISQLIVFKNNTTGTNGTPQIMVEFGTNTTMNHTGGSTISKLAAGDTLKMVVASGEISFDQNDNFSVAYIG